MYIAGLIVTTILVLAYCWLILQYRKWFKKLQPFRANSSLSPKHFFTVIIPARDEAAGIEACIRTILNGNYPAALTELIVVNDFSTDQTVAIVEHLQKEYANLKLIHLEKYLDGNPLNAYKKKAIEIAISESKGDWIVTTDADCAVSPEWLTLFDAYIQQHQSVLVAAPVMFTHEKGLLSLFQLLDFMSLQGITAAAVSAGYHTMCNGANLAYQKAAFYAVGQFKGIDSIASGDDMLLMYKIQQQYPEQLGYLFHQQAIVKTEPMHSWKGFINQRIRWASKADKYDDKNIFRILALVYAVNLALLVLLPVNLFVSGEIAHWLTLMLLKTLVELMFMRPVAKFYQQKEALLYFPLMQPLHLFYTVVAGWLGKFGSYQWKGRTVK